MTNYALIFFLILLSACSTIETTPKNTENLCAIFQEKQHWLAENEDVSYKWGLPIYIQMAILHQESHFVANARPLKSQFLGFDSFSSSAYGYAQALDGTWSDYLRVCDNDDAERHNFADACDFVGWYTDTSYRRLGISKLDTYNLYLAYHEGNAGYKRKSYLKKPWLLTVANKVSRKAAQYRQQFASCAQELKR